MKKRAIVLLSGGLDSATLLFYVKSKQYRVHCLVFDYGQRHKKEISQAKKIAKAVSCPLELVKISFPWKGSCLLDTSINVPQNRRINPKEIPSTYVAARNIIFLSFAASFAEVIGAQDIFIGANARDYSGYPDCRSEFFDAFQQALAKGSKSGVRGKTIKIRTPLVNKTKAQIIQMGLKLKVPYALTWSCYLGGARPCGTCDSCVLRQRGFREVGREDPCLQGNSKRILTMRKG